MRQVKIKKTRYLAFFLLFLITPFVFSLALAAFNDIYLPIVYYEVEPTAIPTEQPTAMPTQEVSGVTIRDNHTYYIDGEDYLHILGEVQNDTPDNLRYVEVDANFYAQDGAFLGTEYAYSVLESLPAFDKACFDLVLPNPVGWSSYGFEAPGYWTDGNPLPDVTVIYAGGAYNPTFGRYEINGQVRNDGNTRVEYVSPVATVYDGFGAVIGCDYTFINSLHLDPGQISSFAFTFAGRDYSSADSYRIQVDGKPR